MPLRSARSTKRSPWGPTTTYYREQRRRFTGERARDDRPEYIPPMFRDPNEIHPPVEIEPEDPGLTV